VAVPYTILQRESDLPEVVLWPSELKNCIGDECSVPDRYRHHPLDRSAVTDRHKMLAKVWQRTNSNNFTEAWKEWRDNLSNPKLTSNVHHTSVKKCRDAADRIKLREAEEILAGQRAAAPNQSRSLLMGIAGEAKTLKKLHEQLQAEGKGAVEQRQVGLWFNGIQRLPGGLVNQGPGLPVLGPITDAGPWVIYGTADAIVKTPSGDVFPVEVKTRTSQLYVHIPIHDMVQVTAYMAMMGKTKVLYVQRLSAAEELHQVEVEWDEGFWQSYVLPGLTAFVLDVRRLMRGAPEDLHLRRAVFLTQQGKPEEKQEKKEEELPPAVVNPVPSKAVLLAQLSPSPVSSVALEGGKGPAVSPVAMCRAPSRKRCRDPVVVDLHRQEAEQAFRLKCDENRRVTRNMAASVSGKHVQRR
jgi:CRISPR/Cas system-associated exonuclease Cas4 (RecB family)